MRWAILPLLCSLWMVACGDDEGTTNNTNNNDQSPECGNGIVEEGELCDDGAQNSDTEPDACRTNCVSNGCGDNVKDTEEECDGDDLDNTICSDVGNFTQGALACAPSCTFDTSACYLCGDGVKDPGESCDGTDFGSAECSTAGSGHQHGQLRCNADCSYDFGLCHTCGDGAIEAGVEECDGAELGGLTCQDLGYAWGNLGCNMADTSCTYDTSTCFSYCGNGQRDGTEECDGSDLPPISCADLDPNLTGGQISCSSACLLSAEKCNRCGNFVRDAGEECDGNQLGGATCESLGGAGGTLGCTSSCRYDTSNCTVPPTCGNGLVDTDEVCDGQNLAGQTCQGLPGGLYGGGHLACSASCLLDTSACTPEVRCGNGVLEPSFGEQCDGADLGVGVDCLTLGYAGGTLACGPLCTYDISGCGVQPPCGNGVVDPGEQCDGAPPAGISCANLDFLGGNIGCLPQCELDVSGCTNCGNGSIDAGEECDGADLGGLSCTDTGAYGGTLSCDPGSCTLDTTGCHQCGNGVADAGEDCDGTDFGAATCATETTFQHGALACDAGCAIDTSGCHTCGNLALEGPEQCDYHLVGPGQCAVQFPGVYDGGGLGCTPDCLGFDVSGCFTIDDGVCNGPSENISNSPNDCGWLQVSAGALHTCGIRGDGTIWCWGRTNNGALGIGPASGAYSTPQPVVGLPLGAQQISASNDTSCAVLDDYSLWCWGWNGFGQLGVGDVADAWSPVQVTALAGVSKVEVGSVYTCATLLAGTVWCWGHGTSGNLGDGNASDSHVPVQVSSLTGATLVATSQEAYGGGVDYQHSCALQGGSAFCWGSNDLEQVGSVGQPTYYTPQFVSGLTGLTSITVSYGFSCAVSGGIASCWGADNYGQLGDGPAYNPGHLPVTVAGITDVQSISAGDSYACAVLTDGSAWCWGWNNAGKLGTGDSADRDAPTQVVTSGGPGLAGIVSISTGSAHTCAVVDDGHAWCWGFGAYGQLGNGSSTDSNYPVQVTEPL